jgi:DNA (cytosine-5)-methyltransferase 1
MFVSDRLDSKSTAFENESLSNHIRNFKVIDLFSGVGGLSLGAARAGFDLLAAIDNDSRAAKAFKLNFPRCIQIQEDIAQITGNRLRDLTSIEDQIVHGVIGGPPCQGFSRIGRRLPNDKRNELFDHFFRIVSEIRPWFYLAENVLGILDAQYENMRIKALAKLKEYRNLPPMILKSSDFGSATSRERVFFIGYNPNNLTNLEACDFYPTNDIEKISVEIALQGLPRKIDSAWQKESDGWRKLTIRQKGKFWDSIFDDIPFGVGNPAALNRLKYEGKVSACLGTKHTNTVINRFAGVKEGSVDGPSRAVRLVRKGFCPTLRSGTGPEHGSFQALRPIHPTEHRVITPREAARLQGFPDWFQFDSTKWHSFRQIGNSVSPILAENILRVIASHLTLKEKRNA